MSSPGHSGVSPGFSRKPGVTGALSHPRSQKRLKFEEPGDPTTATSRWAKMIYFYIAQYPVRWTAQSALHLLPSLTDMFIPTPFSTSLGSIQSMLQWLRKDSSPTCPPLSTGRDSLSRLSELGHRGENTNAQTLIWQQRGFEPRLSRLRGRCSTAELPRSTGHMMGQEYLVDRGVHGWLWSTLWFVAF